MACKLLLVDDSVTIRRVVELTFAGEDVNVVAVGDGREAMDRILADRPDIVLADVGLREPDGYQVAGFVKRHPALRHVPVVLLTGAFQPIDRARAVECGCDGVLAKPFDLQSMVGVVRGLLQAARRQDPTPDPPTGNLSDGENGTGDGGPSPMLDWWASLLEEPEPQAVTGPAAEPAERVGPRALPISTPPTLAPETGLEPASLDRAPLSLDDYFDLVDEVLARTKEVPPQDPRTSQISPFKQ